MWETDQSCPDITMLPKLAEVFGITTDELLGLQRKEVQIAEVVTESDEKEPEGLHVSHGTWEFKWDSGRRSGIGFGIWMLLVGVLLLLGEELTCTSVGLLDLLLPTGLLVFGLFGIYPRFSIFRLGCSLLGVGFLLDLFELIPFSLNLDMLLPIFLLLVGANLVVNAIRKPHKGNFHITHNGKDVRKTNYTVDGERFVCSCSFGESSHLIQLPRLSSGTVQNSFGETRLDFSGCGEFAEGCILDASCSFGELELLFPRSCRVVSDVRTSFASVDFSGQPDADAAAEVRLSGSVSFGEITVRYL